MTRRALFLDKDGVINVNHGYVCTPERTDFIGGIFDLCRTATQHGWLNVVVTNQAGIGRGYYTEQEFKAYMDWVRAEFDRNDARLDAVYYCPHHPVHGQGAYLRDCDCRKPKPGMLLAAQREWDLDLPHSVLLGDSDSDLAAGRAAGVGRLVSVRTQVDAASGQVVFDEAFQREVRGLLDVRAAHVRLSGEQW